MRRSSLTNRIVGCALMGGLILLPGCSAAADKDARSGPEKQPAPSKTRVQPRAYDPVTKFGEQEFDFPGDLSRAMLDGTTAWITGPDDLTALDLTTGENTVVRPKGQAPEPSPLFGRPVLADLQGRRVALALLPVSTPGSGTFTDQDAVEMLVVDARTRKTVWSAEIADVEPGFSKGDTGAVVGADGGVAVVDAGSGLRGVDLTTRKTVWKTDASADDVAAVGEGVVALTESNTWGEDQLYGLRVSDGKRAWTFGEREENLNVTPIGPRRLLVTQGVDVAYDRGGRVVNLADGRQVASPEYFAVPDRCLHDGESTAVCFKQEYGQRASFALDTASGKVLWELPTQDRFAPSISAVWHGVVYAQTGEGPLMLDARTGKDRAGRLPDAPDLVNAYVGLFQRDEDDFDGEPPTTLRLTAG